MNNEDGGQLSSKYLKFENIYFLLSYNTAIM